MSWISDRTLSFHKFCLKELVLQGVPGLCGRGRRELDLYLFVGWSPHSLLFNPVAILPQGRQLSPGPSVLGILPGVKEPGAPSKPLMGPLGLVGRGGRGILLLPLVVGASSSAPMYASDGRGVGGGGEMVPPGTAGLEEEEEEEARGAPLAATAAQVILDGRRRRGRQTFLVELVVVVFVEVFVLVLVLRQKLEGVGSV
ncbi:hypothetical protein BDZ91DRAFT_802948 [Kalaharituber pfeilii]|nr:hypothetical protein BDZ91DRAFT_802948 [Kalaharituber pfeilii]